MVSSTHSWAGQVAAQCAITSMIYLIWTSKARSSGWKYMESRGHQFFVFPGIFCPNLPSRHVIYVRCFRPEIRFLWGGSWKIQSQKLVEIAIPRLYLYLLTPIFSWIVGWEHDRTCLKSQLDFWEFIDGAKATTPESRTEHPMIGWYWMYPGTTSTQWGLRDLRGK